MATWEELDEAYLNRFFPLTLTSERKEEIITFKQKEDESLFNAYEGYKQLLRRCPMHGIEQRTQMDSFYHAMNYTSKGIIDAACCGAFNSIGRVLKRPISSLKIWLKEIIELHLRLQGTTAD